MDKMFTKEHIFAALLDQDISVQIETLEGLLKDFGIAEVSDVLAVCLLPIMLDLDAGEYPTEVVSRVKILAETVRTYNIERFAADM